MKYKKELIEKLLTEKMILSRKYRTKEEAKRLRELNELPLPKGLKDYDYKYYWPWWLKISKKVGKFLMDWSEKR